MIILVTGSNGFLGKSIERFLGKKHELIGLSRTAGDYKLSLEKEVPTFSQKFDLVVHAAGKAHSIPRTPAEKKQFFDVNVLGTNNLLQGLLKVGAPKRFVFISSVSVYGQESGNAINEASPLMSKDPYGLSKIEAEKIVTNWCEQNKVICTILRLPLLVGDNPPGNLGAMIKAIEKGYYFNIGGGKARKSMVLAEDVTDFIPIVSEVGGTFNLTDGEHPSFYELSNAISAQKNKKNVFNLPLFIATFISLIGNLLGNKAPINSLKLKKITCNLTFDDAKARQELGWKPQNVLRYFENNNK